MPAWYGKEMRIGIKKDIDTPPKLANWKTSTAVELCTVRWARISWFKSSPMRASVLPISLTRILLTLASSYWECPVELFEYPPMKELQRRTIRLYQVISFLLSTNKKESYKRHGQVFIALVNGIRHWTWRCCDIIFTLAYLHYCSHVSDENAWNFYCPVMGNTD